VEATTATRRRLEPITKNPRCGAADDPACTAGLGSGASDEREVYILQNSRMSRAAVARKATGIALARGRAARSGVSAPVRVPRYFFQSENAGNASPFFPNDPVPLGKRLCYCFFGVRQRASVTI